MIKQILKGMIRFMGRVVEMVNREANDPKLLAMGSLLSMQQWTIGSRNINDYEFRIFSEWGDDGIIQYLIKHVQIQNTTFIEFGVENYMESNTRFLMMNNNWSGFVMDGSAEHMNSLRKRSWFFRYDIQCRSVWIDKDNINKLLSETGFSDIGLLHIDLDGNDYYILLELDFTKLNPSVLIMEYNAVFGSERAITVPYRNDFNRTKAHYSNLFFGASLAALNHAAEKKGYSLIGCNLAGNNAYFVRNDLLNDYVKKTDVKTAFKESKFRQSRNQDYSLSFLSAKEGLTLMSGLSVINVLSDEEEKL